VEKLRLTVMRHSLQAVWVRDFLLRRKTKDVDIATSATPDEVLRLFPKSRPSARNSGSSRFPCMATVYEVATFRSDSAYLDGRHPAPWFSRVRNRTHFVRDFTINGLFFDPVAGRLIDYVPRPERYQDKIDPDDRQSGRALRGGQTPNAQAIRLACTLSLTLSLKPGRQFRGSPPISCR